MLKASRLLTSPGVQNTAPGLSNYQMFRYDNYGFNSTVQDSTGIKVLTLNTGQYLIFNSPSFSSANDTRFSATLFNADNTIQWAKNYDIDSTNEFYLVDACLEQGNTWGASGYDPKLQTNTKAYVCGYSNQGGTSAEQGWVLQINLSDGSLGWTHKIYTTVSSSFYTCRCVGIRMVYGSSSYVQVAIRQNYWGYSGNSPWQSGYYLQFYTSNGTFRYSWLYSSLNESTYTTAIADSTTNYTRGVLAGTVGNHSGSPYVSSKFYMAYYFSFTTTSYYIRSFQPTGSASNFKCIPIDIAYVREKITGGGVVDLFYIFGYVYDNAFAGKHHRHFVLKWSSNNFVSGSISYFKTYKGETSLSYHDFNDSPLDPTSTINSTTNNREPQTGKSQIVFDQSRQHFYITLSSLAPSGSKQRAHIFECRTSDGEVTHQYILESSYGDLIAGSCDVDIYGNLIFCGSISQDTSNPQYKPFIVKLPPPRQQIISGTYNVGTLPTLDVTISTGSVTAADYTSDITTSYTSTFNWTTSTSTTYVGRQLYNAGTFTTNDSTTSIVSDNL